MSQALQAVEALADLLAPIMAQKQAKQFGLQFKHDVTGTPKSQYTHGPGGVLSWPGVDPVLFNAALGTESILSMLPTKGSPSPNPTSATLTGVTADAGSEKEDVCDDAPRGGLMKACMIPSQFGRYERATDQIELNRLGQRVDRADPRGPAPIGAPVGRAGPFRR